MTGDLGIAVASHYFAVGAVVPWADASIGTGCLQGKTSEGVDSMPVPGCRAELRFK